MDVDYLGFTGYGASEGNMDGFADTVEEQASDSGMSGFASVQNRAGGGGPFAGGMSSPTTSLVLLWFGALGLYWFMGWFFKGRRAG